MERFLRYVAYCRHSRESGNPFLLLAKNQDGLTSFAVVERLRFRGNDGKAVVQGLLAL
jgi:hypothetical protein